MNATGTRPEPEQTDSPPAPSLARAVFGFLVYILLIPGLLMLSAGDRSWQMGWIFVALLFASMIGSRLIVSITHPELLKERARFSQADGVEPWDRVVMPVMALVVPLVTVLVAGLDHRFGWGPVVPVAVQYAALALLVGGHLVAVWAMLANPFFSAVVRIQHDRGHRVIRSGPYAFVRHPAYAGGLLSSLAVPFMLDALWAMVPTAVGLIATVIRTVLEDRTLTRSLSGYREYAQQVRTRLVPWLW